MDRTASWPAWSPDGTRIAFTGRDSRSAYDTDIYVVNVDGSGLVRLTNDPRARDAMPSWSSDGLIAFVREAGINGNPIFVMNADGTEQRAVTPLRGAALSPAWKPGAP
jgi:TolB protein